MDLAAWLASNGFGEYAPGFAENRIGADLLSGLTDQDLHGLGVVAMGDRKRLLAAIAGLGVAEDVPARPGEGERRQVTVLFADIAGFTAMSERLGAEATHDVLNRYFAAADRIVEEFGGAIDKHIGDNVMAVFGAPVAHDNDPERAALAIHEAVQSVVLPGKEVLRLHIGIASGQVVASGTGSDSHREYTVTGDTVNLAARLEGLAGPGQTLVSEAVQQRTAGHFEATGLGPQVLKGIARPVAVWRVEGETRIDAPGRGTPFVGRRSELGQCRAILGEVVATGEGQTILLRGAAGIGKTRLAEEVLGMAREAGFALHRCLVLDFGSRKGQDAIPALVRSLLGLPPSCSKDARTRAADDGLSTGAYPEADRVFLNDLLDLPQPLELRRLYDAMDDTARRGGRRALVAGLAAWASNTRPQLILVEDLHWADAQTLDNLAAVMATASEHPVVLLATTRPEGDPLEGAWRAVGHDQPVSIINLGALRASEARAMATGFARANQDRLAECLERAAGNPLFLEQLLQNATESTSDQVPGSIQSLVLARMDRLEAPDKRALQAASVFGQRFSLAALRHLLDDPAYDCAGLLAHQLFRPEGEDFLFAHALIRDGVYESILTAARTRLHLKAAKWFEASDSVLHAEHLKLAQDPGAAMAFFAAAQSQATLYRMQNAIGLARTGLDCAATGEDQSALALLLGRLLQESGHTAEAIDVFEHALVLAADDATRCQAHLGLGTTWRLTDEYEKAMAEFDRAEVLARRAGLKAKLPHIHHMRGNVHFPLGQLGACLSEHRNSLELARQLGLAEEEAAALGGIADAEYAHGHMMTANARWRECIKICRTNGFGRIEVANSPMLGLTDLYCISAQQCVDTATTAAEAARRVGHYRAEMIAHLVISFAASDLGRLDMIDAATEAATELIDRLGARRFMSDVLMKQGYRLLLSGNRGGAAEKMRQSIEDCRETKSLGYNGARLLGALVRATDDEAERESALDEGERILASGVLKHSALWFYRDAIEAMLHAGAWNRAETYAQKLRECVPVGEVPWAKFYADRGSALAAHGGGGPAPELIDTIRSLRQRAAEMALHVAAQALDDALSAT